MSKYRSDAGWSDSNELRCLLAYKQLEEAVFPHTYGLITHLTSTAQKSSQAI